MSELGKYLKLRPDGIQAQRRGRTSKWFAFAKLGRARAIQQAQAYARRELGPIPTARRDPVFPRFAKPTARNRLGILGVSIERNRRGRAVAAKAQLQIRGKRVKAVRVPFRSTRPADRAAAIAKAAAARRSLEAKST